MISILQPEVRTTIAKIAAKAEDLNTIAAYTGLDPSHQIASHLWDIEKAV